jgi:GntR family transcriptional regulator
MEDDIEVGVETSVEPFKARRAYLLLRERIHAGELVPGARLPGEPAMAAECGVSRVTLRRALDQLAAEGLVERRPGVGTFVREAAPLPPAGIDFADVFAHLKEMGRRTEVRLLSFGYVLPTGPVAAALGLSSGQRAQRAVRVRMMAGAPFSFLTTHVPEQIGQTYSEAEMANQPLLSLLERSGIRIARARQDIGATLAGPDLAEVLQVETGAPLLSLTRVVEDAAGRAVEYLQALYRPDRFTFQMQLARTGEDGARRWSPLPPSAPTGEPA